ncbi:zinc transporter foi [Uranotaenia lowii]|uniref:zinc transporter foi n=1 Tax=Uranotaenia lowii TaxID=190385 RepID=UPI00247A6720|nr:zinc transporter foi [Uranotaenia lowii]XP_055612079.1 zinc transporter foi [Uranotaenia lowii]XP_055612080.1 zinc transporter foi [Uranotaenia lowii]XP_055612081.1 zinc transporter foi [Uranotaenia lowii]XP_055612082.1 zinc transporter foi [Uranotaenia lowii]
MARHIMAVCVVCLLCADHLPCKQHDDLSGLASNRIPPVTTTNGLDFRSQQKQEPLVEPNVLVKRHTHGHDDHDHHGDHDGHDHDRDEDESAKAIRSQLDPFMQRIFAEFGDPDTMTMNVAGFEKMMKQLNMYQLNTDVYPGSTTVSSHGVSETKSCINSVDFLKHMASPKSNQAIIPPVIRPEALISSNNKNSNEGMSSSSTNKSFLDTSINSKNVTISEKSNGTNNSLSELEKLKSTFRIDRDDLFNICPILLAQLSSTTSYERAGCIDPSIVPDLNGMMNKSLHNSVHHHHGEHGSAGSEIDPSVWLYSTLAILGVSLCGLLGVAVIPCMDKHGYQHVLQFLVALAVGTLCGDALLHLLPHAMMHTTMANSHDEMMYKGLAAVSGIVFFYFMERFLTVVAEWYKHKEKKDKPSSRVRVMRDPEVSSLHNATGGEKQCKHKYSSYPYCYDEIAMDTKDDHHEHNHVEHHNHNNHNNASAKCANLGEHGEHGDGANNHHHHHHHHHRNSNGKDDPTANQDVNTVSTNLDDASIESNDQLSNHKSAKIRPENYTIILREHETKHHGHSHTHGHVHSPPGSLSAVAWMVIMGDGLHNFTDGMTIGAAFANNIAGGFSTAIAVFCHELPHELGDFAVLLKAGMSARDAVYYNLLSSILSFFGMVIGILIGHQAAASAWVFSVAAGLFLYIALVDMIPELTSSHGAGDSCRTSEFLLQFVGMTAGFGIMLLIAMYEHDLKEMFVD